MTPPFTKNVKVYTSDDSVYFTDGVTYEGRETGVEDAPRVIVVVFTPTNGPDRGTRHEVPLVHVRAVVGSTAAAA